jgi:hypothetical protein
MAALARLNSYLEYLEPGTEAYMRVSQAVERLEAEIAEAFPLR